MNLPDPKDITAYIDTLFGADYTRELRGLAKPVNPLRECTPQPWDTTPFPSEVEL